LIVLFLVTPLFPAGSPAKGKSTALKAIEMPDILAWKTLRAPLLSEDGKWFAYCLVPVEGDSEIVVKNTAGPGAKEYKFPVGKFSGYSARGTFAFSHDSQWVAYKVFPTEKEKKAARKTKKKLYNKVGLVNLKTGDKETFENTKAFSFSKENPGWIALHKYPPKSGDKKNKWKGSDLILVELATSKTFNIGNVAGFAFNKSGQWLAWTIDAADKAGNGIMLKNLKSGQVTSLDTGKFNYKQLTWTEKGDALAVLKGKEDDGYEDELYRLVGFKDFSSKNPQKVVFDPAKEKTFPAKMSISPDRAPLWTENLSGILFGIRELKEKKNKKEKNKDKKKDKKKGKKKKKPGEEKTKEKAKDSKSAGDKEKQAGVVIWHWKDKRLQSQQQKEEDRDKKFSFLCIYRVKEKKFLRLADEKLRRVNAAPKHRWAIGRDNSAYLLAGNLHGRRFNDIYVIDLESGKRTLALKKVRWYFSPSFEGTHFLYYNDGHFYTYDMAKGQSINITESLPTSFVNTEDSRNVVKPPIYPVGWAKGGKYVLLDDNWDIWKVPAHGEGEAVNLTVNGKKEQVRYYRRLRLDPDEKGIDLTAPIYIRIYGEWTKKGGIARLDKEKPGAQRLLWDDAHYSSLLKAKNSDTYIYSRQTYKDCNNYFVTGPALKKGKKISDAYPEQEKFLWSSGVRLVNYKNKQGKKLQGALILPANYQKGKSYPTVVYIYEKLSQYLNRYTTPSTRGFSRSVYNSSGYAVFMPDIINRVNDPGVSSVECVLPAVEAAIATGVVDPERIGIHGHSWGGYQTAFLITQTDMFRAAVAGAPLTNMISMYSSIYWNVGFANQPLFESGQGRFSEGYWKNMKGYIRNSPVFFAEKVKTPLLLLHNDKDGAVDFNQGIEYFNTLKRLGKEVVMLQYKGENHGVRKPENRRDYTIRMKQFFDHHLKGKDAPKWYSDGIPHLKHKEHIEELSKLQKKSKK
jgi:dipeptidyl aminopeptidase/acylaminoacyl peptidase